MRLPQIALAALTALAAAPAAAQDGDPQARIAAGFKELGMPEARADCFGVVIGEKLKANEMERAAEIVTTAESSEAIRQSVTNAGMKTMDAFAAANNQCRRWGRE